MMRLVKLRSRFRHLLLHGTAASILALAGLNGPLLQSAHAQTSINLRDADIRTFIDDVARVTGTSFVIDPRVQGKVSVVSDKPLGRTQYFELFLATLRANGFVAVPAGSGQYRVQPAEAGAGAVGGRYSTAVIPLTFIDAQQAVESLRPILSRNGSASANRAGNAVIIADFTDNIARARTILKQVDRDNSNTQLVSLKNAGARDIAASLLALLRQPSDTGNAARVSIVPIDASNAIALRGEPGQVAQLAKIARDLDGKAAGNSESRVIFLQHADAAAIMPVLQQLMGQAPSISTGASSGLSASSFGASNGAAGDTGNRDSGGSGLGGSGLAMAAPSAANVGVASGDTRRRAIIARYEGANALVIAASPEIQRELGEIIRQLDTRRAQVQVEAIIVEISDEAAKKLGVQFLLAGRNGTIPLVSSTFSDAAPNLMAVTGAIAAEKGLIPEGQMADNFRTSAINSLMNTNGLTSGLFSLGSDLMFSMVVNAVKTDGNSNLLSTPSLITLDNQPARILVGKEIPVTTGEALGDNLDNSFRTVQRQDVGIQLTVRPQINAGGTVTLNLKQVVSSIDTTVGDRDFVLNKRELETAVSVADGQILALGGLLEESERRSLQKIPLLGDIPGLGQFFRSSSRSRTKTNLMVFIRPTIVRTQAQADALTANRWDHVREMELQRDGVSSLDALAWYYLRSQLPYKPAPMGEGQSLTNSAPVHPLQPANQ